MLRPEFNELVEVPPICGNRCVRFCVTIGAFTVPLEEINRHAPTSRPKGRAGGGDWTGLSGI